MLFLLFRFFFFYQGGQFLVTLVDFFGASFLTLVLAIAQMIAIGWIYGKNGSVLIFL
jgi:solute carrier family 6 (neurotransmitter transporter, glycine) member 5/9